MLALVDRWSAAFVAALPHTVAMLTPVPLPNLFCCWADPSYVSGGGRPIYCRCLRSWWRLRSQDLPTLYSDRPGGEVLPVAHRGMEGCACLKAGRAVSSATCGFAELKLCPLNSTFFTTVPMPSVWQAVSCWSKKLCGSRGDPSWSWLSTLTDQYWRTSPTSRP